MMKKAILLLTLLTPILFYAQVGIWSDIIDVNDNASNGFTRPRIAITTGNVPIVSWGKKNNLDVFVSRKSGMTFSTDKKLNPGNMKVFAQDWVGPELAASGDNVFVSFKSQPENEGFPYVVKSSDGGLTFSDTIRVSSNNWSRFPTVDVDVNGRPYVAFMEFDSGFINPHYAVSTSANGGLSFNNSVIGSGMAPGEVCDCCPAHIYADSSKVALFFRNNDNNLRDIWTATSVNDGASFSNAADIDNNNWMIFSCPSTGPDAISIGDSLIAVWMSGASGLSRVNLGTTDFTGLNIGRNFEIDANVQSNANQNYPRIAGSGDTIGIVWQESFQGQIYIKGVFSTTGIQGLISNPVDTIGNLSDPALFNPDVAFSNGYFHIVWQNNVQQKVQYRSFLIDVEIGIYSSRQKDSGLEITIYPNPVSDELNVIISKKLAGKTIEIRDVQGRLITWIISEERATLDVSDYEKGMYFASVKELPNISTKFIIE